MYLPNYLREAKADIPSRCTDLLRRVKNRRIVRLERFWYCSPCERMRLSNLSAEQIFSLFDSPLLITLDSQAVLGAYSSPSLMSVVLWLEEDESGVVQTPQPIRSLSEFEARSADDPVYSNDTMRSFVSKQITEIRLLQQEPPNSIWVNRPREVGLVLVCDGNEAMVLSHGLHNNSDDFSVITRSMIHPTLISELTEIPLNL